MNTRPLSAARSRLPTCAVPTIRLPRSSRTGSGLPPSVVTLRRKDPDTPRPYRVPGGEGVLIALTAITTLIIAATLLLFLWPEIPHAPAAWSFTGPLLAIVGVTLAVGEVIVFRQMRRLKAAGSA